MPVPPKFATCLVCEAIRPELHGKLILLGFFGVCPNVAVGLRHLDQPAVLTFLLSGSSGDGSFVATYEIVDESDQRVIATTAQEIIAVPDKPTQLVQTLLPTFGHAGEFSIRCVIGGAEAFRGLFRVTAGSFD